MDIGIISSRYAKALYRFAGQNKEDAQVYAEMQCLDTNFRKTRALSAALLSPVLSDEQKNNLLLAAAFCDEKEVSESTRRFLHLIVKKKRADLSHFMAMSYTSLYEREKHLTTGSLTTACPISEQLTARIKALIETQTGNDVRVETKIRPELGGGFILQYGDFRMDASLSGQLNRMRRELK